MSKNRKGDFMSKSKEELIEEKIKNEKELEIL